MSVISFLHVNSINRPLTGNAYYERTPFFSVGSIVHLRAEFKGMLRLLDANRNLQLFV